MDFKVIVNHNTDKINESFLVSEERMKVLNDAMSDAVKDLLESEANCHSQILSIISKGTEHAISLNEVVYVTFKATDAIVSARESTEIRRFLATLLEASIQED